MRGFSPAPAGLFSGAFPRGRRKKSFSLLRGQNMTKLNLGAGDTVLEGYEPRDGARGDSLFPLPDADGSIDEIRASHVLEHFASAEVPKVIADWTRALKPGGVLKIAVPDFEVIAGAYLQGKPVNVQGYVMGGQTDDRDFHKTIFDQDELERLLRSVGLIGIRRWDSEIADCARLPVSLNLAGTKPLARRPRVAAAMSVPRLGFMDNFFAAMRALPRLGITLHKHTGAFWGQCLTRCIEEILEAGEPEYILTIDYDTIFTDRDVEQLLALAVAYPEVDAIAALQASRWNAEPLMTKRAADGKNGESWSRETFAPDLTAIATAHFGLTLIKVEALKTLPLPWFKGEPDADGRWGDAKVDDDIWFWKQWEAAGRSLMLANHVVVGHAELMIRWPDRNLQATYQLSSEFWKSGPPANVWR
jgi:SAM-dependent methyltransferase